MYYLRHLSCFLVNNPLFSGFRETGSLRSVSLSVLNLVFAMGSFNLIWIFFLLSQIMMVTWYVHVVINSLKISNICIRKKTQRQPSYSWIKRKSLQPWPSTSGYRRINNKQSIKQIDKGKKKAEKWTPFGKAGPHCNRKQSCVSS